MADDQADPDFLALSQRARDCIDRAYDRAVRRATGGSRKRRKLNPGRHDKGSGGQEYAGGAGSFLPEGDEGGGGFITEDDDAGGFIPDEGEGGFVPDDDGAGGFLPDDGDAGGFIADDTSDPKVISTSASTPTGSRHAPKVPLTRIPALLSQLNLPADDDVLNVFRASATGWADEEGDEAGSSRRRRPNEPEEEDRDSKLGVERKDFRAVCAALLGGDEGDLPLSEDEGEDVDMEQEASNADVLGPGRRRQRPSALAPPSGSDDEDDEDGDGFEPTMSEGSSLSSLSSDSEYGASRKRSKATSTTTPKGKSKGKGKARAAGTETDASAVTTPRRKGKSKKDALVADDGPIKLNTRQKEMVRTLWEMLKPPQAEQQQGASRGRRGGGGSNPNVLGRDEVKAWVRQLGEMWTDDEITDMVSLFSTQHEKRGLSFEDFGQVMDVYPSMMPDYDHLAQVVGLETTTGSSRRPTILVVGDSQVQDPNVQAIFQECAPGAHIIDTAKRGYGSLAMDTYLHHNLETLKRAGTELDMCIITCSNDSALSTADQAHPVSHARTVEESFTNIASMVRKVHEYSLEQGASTQVVLYTSTPMDPERMVYGVQKVASNANTIAYAYGMQELGKALATEFGSEAEESGVTSVSWVNVWDPLVHDMRGEDGRGEDDDDEGPLFLSARLAPYLKPGQERIHGLHNLYGEQPSSFDLAAAGDFSSTKLGTLLIQGRFLLDQFSSDKADPMPSNWDQSLTFAEWEMDDPAMAQSVKEAVEGVVADMWSEGLGSDEDYDDGADAGTTSDVERKGKASSLATVASDFLQRKDSPAELLHDLRDRYERFGSEHPHAQSAVSYGLKALGHLTRYAADKVGEYNANHPPPHGSLVPPRLS